jgi:hypothetical protein
MSNVPIRISSFTRELDPTDAARELINYVFDQHGARTGTAIANLAGVSKSTVYKYRREGSQAFRMQLPTYIALSNAVTKVLK